MTTGEGSFIFLHEDRRASYGWRPAWAEAILWPANGAIVLGKGRHGRATAEQ